jgi:hypothetical protein
MGIGSESMRATDTVHSNAAEAFVVAEGVFHRMFYAKSFEATVEKTKAEIKLLGRRMTAHKAAGLKGSGKMTIYYVCPHYRRMMERYKNSGKDVYFTIITTNNDPESTVGALTTSYFDCNIDSVVLSKFDTEGEVLDEEVSFTFDDYAHISQFADNP